MLRFVKRFVADEQGLETVEYAVAAALITAASVAAFFALGGTVTGVIEGLNTAIGGGGAS